MGKIFLQVVGVLLLMGVGTILAGLFIHQLNLWFGRKNKKQDDNLSYVLILGREIEKIGYFGNSFLPEPRYKKILRSVADNYPAKLAGKVRIVIPGGKLYGNPISHSAVAKKYLLDNGLPSEMILIAGNQLPSGEFIQPARSTCEELKNIGHGNKVTVVCEILQWPRAFLMALTMGGMVRWKVVVGWTGWKDIFYQFILTIYTLFDPYQFLVHFLLVKYMREKLSANPF